MRAEQAVSPELPPVAAIVPASERIALRTLRAPDAWPVTGEQAWAVAPGETFAAGALLGEITFALPPAGGFLAGALERWPFRRPPRLRTYPVCAPEDGVLTWHRTASGAIGAGELLAIYIPLQAWQEYEQLLSEHEQQREQYAAALRQAAAVPAAADLSAQLDAMIAWAAALSPRSVRADRSALLPLLARHVRQTLRGACPVAPEELALLYHRYFCLIQAVDERFLALDARYAALLRAPALSQAEQAELRARWQQHKETVIRQVLGGTAENGDALS